MKLTFINDFIFGILLTLICWLITFNNFFLFSIFTILVVPILFISFFILTTPFKWWLTIITFLICFTSANLVLEGIMKLFPNGNWVDEQSFPLSNYIVANAAIIGILKIIVDLIFKSVLSEKFTKKQFTERILKAYMKN